MTAGETGPDKPGDQAHGGGSDGPAPPPPPAQPPRQPPPPPASGPPPIPGPGSGPGYGPGPGYGYGPGYAHGYAGGPGNPYSGQGPTPYGTPPWPGGPPPGPPKPGVIPLRPLGVGDILTAVFSTVGRYWRQLYGVLLVLVIGAVVICGLVAGIAVAVVWDRVEDIQAATHQADASGGSYTPTADQVVPLILAGSVVLLVIAVVGLYVVSALQAVHAVAASRAVIGAPLTARELWRTARPRVPAVMGVQLLSGLIIGGIALVGYAVIVGLVVALATGAAGNGGHPNAGLLVVTVIASVVLGLGIAAGACYFSIRFLAAPATATLEGASPVAALRRSSALVRGLFWRSLGITLLVGLLVWIAEQILQYAMMLVGGLGVSAAAAGGDTPDTANMAAAVVAIVFVALAVTAGSLIAVPFSYLTGAMLYVDMRIRHEGFDLELARAAGLPPHRAG